MENSSAEIGRIVNSEKPITPNIPESIPTPQKPIESDKQIEIVEKEPWQITRTEFFENYYLHGTPEENLTEIKKLGGITKGAYIKVASDTKNTAVAYATGAEEHDGSFSRSGRGNKNGVILVAKLDDIISPKQKDKMGTDSVNPSLIYVYEEEKRIGKYKEIIPIDVDPHRYLIEKAIENGEKIPQDVLRDYPDIALKLGITIPPPDIASVDYQWGSISFHQTLNNPEIATTEKLEYWTEHLLKRFQDTKMDTSLAIDGLIIELDYRAKNNGKNKRNWHFEVPKKEFLKELRSFISEDNVLDQKKVNLTTEEPHKKPAKKILSFFNLIKKSLIKEGKENLSNVEKEFNPEELVSNIKRDFNLTQEYSSPVGVWEGYTLEQHTLMVMRQFERYFSQNMDFSLIGKNEFRTLLALHDLGKVRAIMQGLDKSKQHEFNQNILPGIFRMMGVEKNIYLMTAIASQDWIGSYIQGKITLEDAISKIQKVSRDQYVDLHQLFNVLKIYYLSDASSYTVDAGGKRSLDNLFEFKREKDAEKGMVELSEAPKQLMIQLEKALFNNRN